jgi:glycosyltransferase involved in cell wall biosynthesis
LKILYVCPLAHETGHMPFEASKEPQWLQADTTLLTFHGIREGCVAHVPELKVINGKRWLGTTRHLRKYYLGQWIMRVMDVWGTVWKAARIGKDYDFILLRDGEPFTFAPHLASFFFPHRNWLVSLTGGNFTTINSTRNYGRHKLLPIIYCALVNNRGWKIVYWLGHRLANFQYFVQDSQTKEWYEKLFKGRVAVVPLGRNSSVCLDKKSARETLNIPQNKLVLLVFGVTHTGKRNELVFKAVADNPNTFLIHAGASYQSLGTFPKELAKKYDVENRCFIDDSFVSEEKKQLYFSACDFVVLSYAKSFSSTSSVLWEACSFNKPVISSDANVLGELVAKYKLGILFKAEDEEDLKHAIEVAQASNTCYDTTTFLNEYSMKKWSEGIKELCEKI